MSTDALGRRSRNHSIPVDEAVELHECDDRLLYYTRLFGPAPQPLQFYVWRDEKHVNYHYFQARMTKLVHGAKNQPPLFIRPDQLNPKYGAKCFPSWNDISEAGIARLKKLEKHPVSLPPKRDPLPHRAMGASIDMSFLALARKYGIEYLDSEYLFAHKNCPESTRAANNPLLVNVGYRQNYEPDRLFGLKYESGYRFFIREDCRGTETLHTLKEKIDHIKLLMKGRFFKTVWGIPNLTALFALTLPGRIPLLLDYLKDDPLASRFLFKAFPQFSTGAWKTPKEPIIEVFEPWETALGLKDISKP